MNIESTKWTPSAAEWAAARARVERGLQHRRRQTSTGTTAEHLAQLADVYAELCTVETMKDDVVEARQWAMAARTAQALRHQLQYSVEAEARS